MIITQDELIREIAEKENIDLSTVRNIFKSTENTVFTHLSSVASSESVTIKLLNGLSLESEYIPQHKVNKGIFKDHDCPAKIKIKSNITKYYKNRFNESLSPFFNS